MMKQTRCYGCDKPIEPEWLPEGEFIVCDECSLDTDKLSVEKLQEIRVEELKDFNSKLLQAELKNQKLQEQLDTAKKALTEIRANIEEHNQIYDLSVDTALLLEGIDGIAFDALAAIGGDDD
ncbi:hypothetical protein [Lactococcus lactis]|uniref:hypothetical protein n=1 Tax=Lactococcus lactis TaxID=1358 RepID=UPI0022B8C53E|nr:hypothetical protein [Lactococcus lactis]MCZ8491993.1 hypothetical protein [Lactococcus lactis]